MTHNKPDTLLDECIFIAEKIIPADLCDSIVETIETRPWKPNVWYTNELDSYKSYETMEFLGDAILGSVVSSYLYRRFHEIHSQTEGFLTKLKIRLICGVYLCKLSKDLKFQEHIIMFPSNWVFPHGGDEATKGVRYSGSVWAW